MTDTESIDALRESLTKALIALDQVYGYTHMNTAILKVVQDAMADAEATLQITGGNQ